MATAKIFYTEIAADATLTMTNEDSDYPKENLINVNQSSLTKSTGVTTKITFDLGSALTILGVAWFNSNMSSATTFTWDTGTTSATADSSTALTKANDSYLIESATKRYVAFEITMPSGVAQMGKVYIFTGNGDLSGDICVGKISNTQGMIETNKKNADGAIYRTIYNTFESFSWSYADMLWADVATLKSIANNAYTCFLPYGTDSDIYYGTYVNGSFDPLTTDTTVADLHFSSSGTFTESPA